MRAKIKAKYVDEEVEIKVGKYHDGSPAIQIVDLEGQPLCTATVFVDHYQPTDKGAYALLNGWAENEGIPEALEEAGIVKLTGIMVTTGFVRAQEAKILIQGLNHVEDDS